MTPNKNNFDLIRLVAALQVAFHHAATHLGLQNSAPLRVMELLPGVPIFFFVSGFLISKSFEHNPRLREYAMNRALRIYPGLALCFALSLVLVAMAGYFDTIEVPFDRLVTWIAAQLSFVQFYNPDFMRHYGTGVLNGSLWTITVELQFYCLVPVIYLLCRSWARSRQPSNPVLLVTVLIFVGINLLYHAQAEQYAEALWFKLIGVSFAPWLYMFLLGVFCQRNFQRLHGWFAGKLTALLISYCVLAYAGSSLLGWSFGNGLNPLLFVMLCLVVFAAAFSNVGLSDKLLRRNDISYGVYIYHMPVVNFLLAIGLDGTGVSLAAAIASTLLMAYLSWRIVEKPALALKRHPLYRHRSIATPGK